MQNPVESCSKSTQMFVQIVSPKRLSLGAFVLPAAVQQRCFFQPPDAPYPNRFLRPPQMHPPGSIHPIEIAALAWICPRISSVSTLQLRVIPVGPCCLPDGHVGEISLAGACQQRSLHVREIHGSQKSATTQQLGEVAILAQRLDCRICSPHGSSLHRSSRLG